MTNNHNKARNPIYQTNDISIFMFTRENIENSLYNLLQMIKKRKRKVLQNLIKFQDITTQSDFIIPKYDDKLFLVPMIFIMV